MLTERNQSAASCAGVPALLKPWQPHPLCRPCLLRQRIGTSVIEPAIKRSGGLFSCPNREITE